MRHLASLFIIPLLALSVVMAVPLVAANDQTVHAANVTDAICDPNGDGDRGDAIDKVACGIGGKEDAQSAVGRILSTVVQTLVFIVGGISVIVIVVGGLMYVLSTGESNNTKRAKDAILYAVIGLLVALVAQGLVSFVLKRL